MIGRQMSTTRYAWVDLIQVGESGCWLSAPGSQLFYCLWQDSRIRETLFELLPKEDICNVRLANSACCNLVTKRLFLRTHLTFTANSFTRQTKIQALSKIGQHIEHLTFYFPHSNATFLPPLIHPDSGREISFLYTPHTSMGSVLERPKFANSGLGEILTSQYPPLFHAASNVPSFINAMKYFTNLRHLTIKTPGQDPKERYRRDIVDYALISLRIALERAPMKKLNKLTLSVHPSAFLYLRHVQGFGCLPSAGRRWKQIRKMHINVDSWDFYGPSPGLDHLMIIQDFLYNFSTSLEKLTFTWRGRKGPCPVALATDPLFAPPRSSQKLFHEVTSPMSPLPPAPSRKPIIFRKLRYLAVRNATMNAAQVAGLVASHQHCVREFDFENSVLISDGSWDDALAPLMSNDSHSGYWTRYSTATVMEVASIHSDNTPEKVTEPEPSAAVAAVAQELLEIDLDGAEDESEDEANREEIEIDLASEVEEARKASLSFANKLKKRTITKRRRKRKPGHKHEEGDGGYHHQRLHRRQQSNDSLDEPHEVRRLHFPWLKRSKDSREEQAPLIHNTSHSRQPSNESLNALRESPLFSTPQQPPCGRLFGEVESIYSTVSSQRLFGEVTPLSHSGSGSEPDLTHSPTDDNDSGVDDYFRPETPTTPRMEISAPILDTSPNMPTLLQPTVYDPTAELCSEISAVQRDLEAEEKHRLVAEDADVQTSALRRAKELVLSRLGREFGSISGGGGGRGSLKKENFGASAFLASARFREGLFGRSGGLAVNYAPLLISTWLYTRPSSLHRYLYTNSSGQHAWALITGSSDGIGKCLASELASRGFNIVLHGRNPAKLENVRDELRAAYPEVEYRILVADASQCHRAEAVDFERIKDELADLHLTVLINCAGAGPSPAIGALDAYERSEVLRVLHLNAAFPILLTATLLPVMRGQRGDSQPNDHTTNSRTTQTSGATPRASGKPILVINIGSITDDGYPMVSFYSAGKAASHILHKALAREAALNGWDVDVEIMSQRIGAVTGVSHRRDPATLFRPSARTLARAVLARTGCGRKSVVPYWPHALQQAFLGLVPEWVVDCVLIKAMRREKMEQDEEAKKK
ncbi:hypothetical protein F5Y19DRAFT_464232 [Xylariaceae sp. FL1651]|nr:hypothetical protein F5Y19DRAFT_464232 [Xylariaceae sp. FL1651]